MKHIGTAVRIFLYLMIYYTFQILFFAIVGVNAMFKGLKNDEVQQYVYKNAGYILIISMIISLIIYFFMLRGKQKNIFHMCNFRNIGIKNVLFILAICISFSMLLSGLVEYVIKFFPSYNETTKVINMSMVSIAGILAVLLCAPIFEEILFRGIILSELKMNLNIVAAIIIQGVLFGVYHMDKFQGIYTAILGILLGILCVKTKSVLGSIIGHITFNVCGTIIFPYLVELSGKFAFLYIIGGLIIFIISISSFSRFNKNNKLKEFTFR